MDFSRGQFSLLESFWRLWKIHGALTAGRNVDSVFWKANSKNGSFYVVMGFDFMWLGVQSLGLFSANEARAGLPPPDHIEDCIRKLLFYTVHFTRLVVFSKQNFNCLGGLLQVENNFVLMKTRTLNKTSSSSYRTAQHRILPFFCVIIPARNFMGCNFTLSCSFLQMGENLSVTIPAFAGDSAIDSRSASKDFCWKNS